MTRFYLQPDHDGAVVRSALEEMAAGSPLRKRDSTTVVVAAELPWGTEYKLKAYVHESREQFAFITDLTVRGKAALAKLGVRFAHAPYAIGAAH